MKSTLAKSDLSHSPQSHPINQPPSFITAYGPKLVVQKHFTGPGRTKQAFKDECDINQIMARYQKTGVIDFVTKHQARYGDVTGMDFQESMQLVAQAQSMFNDLPSGIRNRFENDPAKFMDFVHDPKNASEMAEMGLMRPDYQSKVTDAIAPDLTKPQAPVKASADSPPKSSQEQPPKAESGTK